MENPDPNGTFDPGPTRSRPTRIRRHPPVGRLFVLGFLSWYLGNLAADQLLGRPPDYVGGTLATAAWLLVFSAFWLSAVACFAWGRVGLEIGPDGVTLREAEHFGLGEYHFRWETLTGTSPVDGAVLLHEAGRITPVDTREMLAGADWIARRVRAARPDGSNPLEEGGAPAPVVPHIDVNLPFPPAPLPESETGGVLTPLPDSAPPDPPDTVPPLPEVPADDATPCPDGQPAVGPLFPDKPDAPPIDGNATTAGSIAFPGAGIPYLPPLAGTTGRDRPPAALPEPRDASDDRVLERWSPDGEARLRLLQWASVLAGSVWVGAAAVSAMSQALKTGHPETLHHYVYRGFLPCLLTLLAGFALAGWIRRVVKAWDRRRDALGLENPAGARCDSGVALSRAGFRILDRVFSRLEVLFFTQFLWLMAPLALSQAGHPLWLHTLTPLCAAYLAGNLLLALVASTPLLFPSRTPSGVQSV